MQLIKPNIRNYLSSLMANGKPFQDLQSYCMFIGYQRSGHTLIGALLDAHPDMVIAHELNALDFVAKGYSPRQIFFLLLQQSKAFYQAGNEWMGYSYRVEGQWQGRYRKLSVIGDKRGGSSSKILKDRPELLQKVNAFCPKLKILHVIRNPFDNIATMVRRREQKRNMVFKEVDLLRKTQHYFDKTIEIERIKKLNCYNILDVYLEDFIANPEDGLKKICKFLEVETEKEYIDNCVKMVFKQSHQSRHKINLWTPEIIESVQDRIDQFNFLRRYSF